MAVGKGTVIIGELKMCRIIIAKRVALCCVWDYNFQESYVYLYVALRSCLTF